MRFLMFAPLLLSAALANAQTPVKPSPAKPVVTSPSTTVKPVTPANQATERPLPVEVRGITITTRKFQFVIRR